MIRVNANEGACSSDGSLLRAPVGSNADEDDGCSSDGSVIRVPVNKANFDGGVEEQGPNLEEIPQKAVEGLGLGIGPSYQHDDENGVKPGSTGQAPAHMKMNLLAASKYFGSKGGASDGGAGAAAEGQRSGSAHFSQREDDNPQVRKRFFFVTFMHKCVRQVSRTDPSAGTHVCAKTNAHHLSARNKPQYISSAPAPPHFFLRPKRCWTS